MHQIPLISLNLEFFVRHEKEEFFGFLTEVAHLIRHYRILFLTKIKST